jgi:hypothetical protein
MLKRLRKDLR